MKSMINYDKFVLEEYEYYGIFGVKYDEWGKKTITNDYYIDTIRFCEIFKNQVNIPEQLEQIKENHYVPIFKHRHQHYSNFLRDKINGISRKWFSELKRAIDKIQTPSQVAESCRISSLMDGVLEYDEAQFHGLMAGIRRESEYNEVIKMIYGQFVMYICSVIDAAIFQVIKKEGFVPRSFSISELIQWIKNRCNEDVKEWVSFKHFNEIRKVNNFLKHSSVDAYEQLLRANPSLVISPNEAKQKYVDGWYALYWIKIDENFLISSLDGINKFVDELCTKCLHEKPEVNEWNYFDWFCETATNYIEEITNPLGI